MKTNLLACRMKASALIICIASLTFSQSIKAPATKEKATGEDLVAQKESLITELQILERETLKFNDPSAEPLSKAEIADAAWELDRGWAKKLLRKAFEITLPRPDQKQERAAGAIPTMPDASNLSRQKLRHRILEIARLQ